MAEGGAHSFDIRELTTEALRYWEVRRIFYNLILVVIFIAEFISAYPLSKHVVSVRGLLELFILAVLANIAFSTVYLPDIFAQFSGFRESRSSWRWILMVIGFAFAGVITHFYCGVMFAEAWIYSS